VFACDSNDQIGTFDAKVQCETDEGTLEKPLLLYLTVNIINIILGNVGAV
jgi:hypothetical protein